MAQQAQVITDQQAEMLLTIKQDEQAWSQYAPEEQREIDMMLREKAADLARIEKEAETKKEEGRIPAPVGSERMLAGGQTYAEASVENGIRKAGYDVVSFGNLLLQTLNDPLVQPPEVTATLNHIDTSIRNWRKRNEAERASEMIEAFGTPDSSFAGMVVGESMATLPFFFAKAPALNNYRRMLLENGAAGAYFSSVYSAGGADSLRDLWGEATVGSLVGLGISALGSWSAVRAKVGRAYVDELTKVNRQTRLDLEKRVQQRLRELKVPGADEWTFTMAGISAENPWIVGMERGTMGELSLTKQNQLIEALALSFQRMSQRLSSGDVRSPADISNRLNEVITKLGRETADLASRTYENHLNRLINVYGDSIQLDGVQYLAALNKVKNELGEVRQFKRGAPQELLDHINFVEKSIAPYVIKPLDDGRFGLVNRKFPKMAPSKTYKTAEAAQEAAGALNAHPDVSGLTTEDVVQILKGHNALIGGDNPALSLSTSGSMENMGRYLKSQLMTSMRGTNSQAILDIQEMTRAYAFEMQRLRMLREGVLGSIFGDGFNRAQPEKALDQLLKVEARGQLANLRKQLELHAPDVLEDVRGALLGRLLSNASNPNMPDNINHIDLDKLINQLAGKGVVPVTGDRIVSNVGRAGMGLFTPIQQQHIIDAAKALRVLKVTYTRDFKRDTMGTISDFTINAVSRSAEFMARFVAREAGQSHTLERILLDPKSRQALIDIATSGPNSPKFVANIAFMTQWISEYNASEERAAVQARNAERRRQLSEQSLKAQAGD